MSYCTNLFGCSEGQYGLILVSAAATQVWTCGRLGRGLIHYRWLRQNFRCNSSESLLLPGATEELPRYLASRPSRGSSNFFFVLSRGSPNLPSASLLAVASPLQDKPSIAACGSEPSARQAERSGKRGAGAAASNLRLKNPEGGLYSRNHPRVCERKAPG